MISKTVQIDIERDLPFQCAIVDQFIAVALRSGRCAQILRNMMVVFSAGVPQKSEGKNHLFDPAAICEAISVLEGKGTKDLTKGPFLYDKGPLAGLYKKHFFQANFMFQNLLAESERDGISAVYRKLSKRRGKNINGTPLTEDDVHAIAEALVDDALERRARRRGFSRDGGLTGEHLIYAKLAQGNFYLYASFHGEPIERIADCCRISVEECPELRLIAPRLFQEAGL